MLQKKLFLWNFIEVRVLHLHLLLLIDSRIWDAVSKKLETNYKINADVDAESHLTRAACIEI